MKVTAPNAKPTATPNANAKPVDAAKLAEIEKEVNAEEDSTDAVSERKKRPSYMSAKELHLPADFDGTGKLLRVPANYNPDTHKLNRTDFADDLVHLEYKATRLDAAANEIAARAQEMRSRIEQLKKLGSTEERGLFAQKLAAAAKIKKIEAKLAELQAAASKG